MGKEKAREQEREKEGGRDTERLYRGTFYPFDRVSNTKIARRRTDAG